MHGLKNQQEHSLYNSEAALWLHPCWHFKDKLKRKRERYSLQKKIIFVYFSVKKKYKLYSCSKAHLIWSLLDLIRFQIINKASYRAISHPGLQSATRLPSAPIQRLQRATLFISIITLALELCRKAIPGYSLWGEGYVFLSIICQIHLERKSPNGRLFVFTRRVNP